MPATAEYDAQADALYVRVQDIPREGTIEFDERHYVDVDAKGTVVGVEVLYPRMGVRVAELASKWGLAGDEMAGAIMAALGESVPLTTTAAVDVLALPYATFSTPGGASGPVTATRSISAPPELIVG